MSELAKQYYADRAMAFDATPLPDVPPILDGQAAPLAMSAGFVSIHAWDSKANLELATDFQKKMETLREYLFAGVPADSRFAGKVPRDHVARLHTFAVRMAKNLLAPRQVTGKVRDIRLEALARAEVDEEDLRRAKTYKKEGEYTEPYEAYLKLSGNLTASGATRPVGGLVVARAVVLGSRLEKGTPAVTCLAYCGVAMAESRAKSKEALAHVRGAGIGVNTTSTGFRARP